MAAIVFPVSSSPGLSPAEGAGRMINCRAEKIGDGGRGQFVRHRLSGIASWGTSSESTIRGSLLNGSTLYVAFSDRIVKFTSAGGASAAVDDLDGDDRVYFCKNNKRPTPDIVIVCQAGVFTLASDTITTFSDSDLPSPRSACFLDGYFFFAIADGRCFASGLNATTINSNDFITTEAKSDELYRPVPWNGQLLLCGSGSIEVWAGQPVNTSGFPYNRVAVIQRGLAGQGAIAGFEDGFGKALLLVGDDNAVHVLDGYTPRRVSTNDIDRLIEAVSDKDTLEAYVYISQGHPIWGLSSPDWTWEYDLSTSNWNERKSYLADKWRGERPFYAFGNWLCGDSESGNIGKISHTTHTEFGNPLVAECWSLPVQNFPNRIRCPRADFDFSMGQGLATGIDPNETDPNVEISYSDDGGYSFSNPRLRPLGKQGKPTNRITLFNNGLTGAQGRIWRVRMSDPRHFGLIGGDMAAELRVG